MKRMPHLALILSLSGALTAALPAASAWAEPATAPAAGPQIHIDVPVTIKQAKIVFNMDHAAFNGDTPVGIKHMTLVLKRFQQPGGPGTTIRFTANDISPDSAYVEFTGLFVRTRDKKRFPFRVLFGGATTGSGNVTPAGPRPKEAMVSKSVSLGSRQLPVPVMTALYEAEDDVAHLK